MWYCVVTKLDLPSESSLNIDEIGQWILENIWIPAMAILVFALGFWSLCCRPRDRRLVEPSEPVASRTRARTQEQEQAEEEEEEQVHGFMFLWPSAIQRAVKNRSR